jgi:hypothetical protein
MTDPVAQPGLRTWHEICQVNWPGRGRLPSRSAYGGGSDVMSGLGNPNGVRRARRGTFYQQRDASTIIAGWINVNGEFGWCSIPSNCAP